jgi:hypothetical protein
MTRDEFMVELQNCAGQVKWCLKDYGYDNKIRTIDGLHCPISWVAHCKGSITCDKDHPFASAQCLGLESVAANEIVDAADYEDAEVDIRNQLLKAVKLV